MAELPKATIALVQDAWDELDAGAEPHELIANVARQAHLISIGALEGRILQVKDIADLIGISEQRVKRIIDREPVTKPIAVIGRIPVYAFEQVDEISSKHLVSAETVDYVMADTRKAAARVASRWRVPILKERGIVRYRNWTGQMKEVVIRIDPLHWRKLKDFEAEDGWPLERALAALLEAYTEERGKRWRRTNE